MLYRYAFAGLLLSLALTATGCETRPATTTARPKIAPPDHATTPPIAARPTAGPTLHESFDEGAKGGYARAEVTLASGVWLLDEALLGTSEQDHKTGRAALRVKPDGRAQMLFDVAGAVGTLTVQHAAYGQDAAGQWQLLLSTNGGKSWQTVGATQTAAPGELQTATFVLNRRGPLRFALKNAGESGRINFDDFTVLPPADATVVPADAVPAPGPAPAPKTAATPRPNAVAGRDDNLALGNPSRAVANPTLSANDFLLTRPEYALSYNKARATANWVSWHLSSAWKGGAARTPQFSPDPLLPAGWYHVSTRDYVNSGFDRGHLCPSDDRDASADENAATFYLTNVIPQAPANNQGPWKDLEEYARDLAAQGNELYIVAGPAGAGGAGKNGPADAIAGAKINVPQWTWKVLLVLPAGDNDLQRITAKTRVIAVQMPNDQSVEHQDWGRYRVSVAQLEKLTHYDFLSNLPKPVQQALEAKVDDGPTHAGPPHGRR